MAQQQALAKRRYRCFGVAAAAVALVALCTISHRGARGVAPRQSSSSYALVNAAAAAPPEGSAVMESDTFSQAVRDALEDVERLVAKVDSGKLVGNFGAQAERIIRRGADAVGPDSAAEFENALDGALHALFLRQLALLRQRILTRCHGYQRVDARALASAEREFVKNAQALLPPSSTWSYEADLANLRSALESLQVRDDALVLERSRAAQAQRATSDVIAKIQGQMEKVGQSLQGSSAGSPWMVWTSYKIPQTPVHVSGKYQQGRANIEFSLDPAVDPANAEAGFVTGLTSKNIGLALNLGF